MTAKAPSARTRVRRHAERGRYDEEAIFAILDEAFICHVGYESDDGPVVLPFAFAREGRNLYLHGAAGNATLGALSSGRAVCVTATLVEGIVLARAAYNHSINYRSVVVLGTAAEVVDEREKRSALHAIVEHLVPGRTADARGPNDAELRATRVVKLALDEASAKIRSGAPNDSEEDLGLPIWAGQIPLRLVVDEAIPDDAGESVETPDYVVHYRRLPSG